MALRIGIDIGSTTVKVVVLDEQNQLLFRSYERHYSKTRERTCETLQGLTGLLGGQEVQLLITGSAGLGVAKAAGLDFVQEVYATAAAVRTFIPQADAVIELGGEDAKIIFFGNTLEERMNGSCAGGTGAFIDQMATLLNVTVDELDALSLRHEKIYPIASRCGVFAKSDIQPILNQGGRKEDVAASIFQAVVDQTVAGLTQGRELKGTIVFLGGPLHFLQGLRERFVDTLHLDSDHAVFPQDGDCFAAIGAALCTEAGQTRPFEEVLDLLEHAANVASPVDTMEPLFTSQAEYEAFAARHQAMTVPRLDLSTYTGPAYLGIDAGSTTTKMVLIDPEGSILFEYYGSNQGNPVRIVLPQLRELYAQCGDRVEIKGAAVTGYGEDLIKNAFSCDLGLVETVAHLNAARHFTPEVDFIIDIGGQDMKCFKIRNGAVDSILLNEACSSGCGSFVETFAKALGYNIADFSKMGLLAQHPVNLGSRCTVFMNSSVKQAQKDGASVEDISAGLSISVVRNAIYKVIRAANADDLGQHIVVQGGTFLNDAVLRSFEREIGREVTRPTISGIMGAYGAALAAKEAGLERSALLSPEALATFTHEAKPATCKLCTNHCSLTINRFDGGRKFISGNRCSRPLGQEKVEELFFLTGSRAGGHRQGLAVGEVRRVQGLLGGHRLGPVQVGQGEGGRRGPGGEGDLAGVVRAGEGVLRREGGGVKGGGGVEVQPRLVQLEVVGGQGILSPGLWAEDPGALCPHHASVDVGPEGEGGEVLVPGVDHRLLPLHGVHVVHIGRVQGKGVLVVGKLGIDLFLRQVLPAGHEDGSHRRWTGGLVGGVLGGIAAGGQAQGRGQEYPGTQDGFHRVHGTDLPRRFSKM